MVAATIISSITVLAVVSSLIVKMDKEGPDGFKRKQNNNKKD
jgi:hypothetical protein